jgi:uncharacterized protein YjiS (DUF1127 family)
MVRSRQARQLHCRPLQPTPVSHFLADRNVHPPQPRGIRRKASIEVATSLPVLGSATFTRSSDQIIGTVRCTIGFVRAVVTEWRHRSRSRHELLTLREAELADLALTQSDAKAETSKWFWQA